MSPYCGRNNKFVSKTGLSNTDKSKFITAKIVEYLGLITDSEKMITSVGSEKTKNL